MRFQVKLKSEDARALDAAVRRILEVVSISGARGVAIPLSTHSLSFASFSKRLIDIRGATKSTIADLQKMVLTTNVEIEINL